MGFTILAQISCMKYEAIFQVILIKLIIKRAYAQIRGGQEVLFGMNLHQNSYFVHASREGSSRSVSESSLLAYTISTNIA